MLPATGRFRHSDDGMVSVAKAMSLGRIMVQGAVYGRQSAEDEGVGGKGGRKGATEEQWPKELLAESLFNDCIVTAFGYEHH